MPKYREIFNLVSVGESLQERQSYSSMSSVRLNRSMRMGRALLTLLAICHQFAVAHNHIVPPPEVSQCNGTLYATCEMTPNTPLDEDLPKVSGQVLFKQDFPEGKLKVLLQINGLTSDQVPRAVHIHQFGDLSQGCGSTGGHFNPFGVDHPHHPGDFGNFIPQDGKINSAIESKATLFGGVSVIGRAVVIHEMEDDMGLGGNAASRLNGNAGRRLGCCVIGICPPPSH